MNDNLQSVKKLTAKEEAWANAYLLTLSKAGAARLAKYKGDSSTLAHIGWENYRKAHIQAYMKDKLDEMAMRANEVLARLGMMGSSSIADFATVSNADELEVHPGASVVKKFKRKVYHPPNADPYEEIELELYDAQVPLLNIGKQHGLFTDKHLVELKVQGEVDALLDILKDTLPQEQYANVLSRLSGEGTGTASTTEPTIK